MDLERNIIMSTINAESSHSTFNWNVNSIFSFLATSDKALLTRWRSYPGSTDKGTIGITQRR